MKLKFPNSTVDFDITPSIFLGGFDVYDREEDLGEHLNEYDPNNSSNLQELFDVYFFKQRHKSIGFTIEHKIEITKMLGAALSQQAHDFGQYFSSEDDYFFLPSEWKVSDPKQFFIQAYIGIMRNWGKELKQVGIQLLDVKQLGV
jgi:hypothetical protein